MGEEPVARVICDGRQRSGFLEQMRGTRYDDQHAHAPQLSLGLPVELEHRTVCASDNQQRGCAHERQARAGEVRAPTARDDRGHVRIRFRGRQQGGGSTGARSEIPDPVGRSDEADQ